jgi:hypothetical protein
MNHDELWDDSALIESWNDAVAEYKVSEKTNVFPLLAMLNDKPEVP